MRLCLACCAALMSLLGTKWSITRLIFVLSNTASKPAFSNSLMATGLVMSLPSTISSFAMMSWPDTTESSPACAARIFCVIVIPIVLLLPPVLCFLDGCFRQIKTVRSAGAIRDC